MKPQEIERNVSEGRSSEATLLANIAMAALFTPEKYFSSENPLMKASI